MLRDLWADVLDARQADALVEDGVHLTRTLLTLDEQGHRQLSDLLLDVAVKALEIEAESRARLGTDGGRATELGVLHFRRPS